MKKLLSIEDRNGVLTRMAELLDQNRNKLLAANEKDLKSFDQSDLAMYDRLKVDENKIDGMMLSLEQLAGQKDPVGVERSQFEHANGLKIYNRTAAFGTVLIIYESRPDVTVEAAGIAFKSGNQILLKGGKESLNSNLVIVDLWQRALNDKGVDSDWIQYLNLSRQQTQEYLKSPKQRIDLIIPRGGEKLIRFVKEHASCPVIVSGRGNNFAYVHERAEVEEAYKIIFNAKTAKISACNALDKVLIDARLIDLNDFVQVLVSRLVENGVEVYVGEDLKGVKNTIFRPEKDMWYEEFLDYKIRIGLVDSENEAMDMINTYGGGHSATIITTDQNMANVFMEQIDAAAVYHNASTRFTDGFEFGLGGELAISTDKLHQRGPIGLQHLVTNKWYVYGNGQIR